LPLGYRRWRPLVKLPGGNRELLAASRLFLGEIQTCIQQRELIFEQAGESRNIVNDAHYQHLIMLKEDIR
jgi:hypothetical protein